MENRTFTDFLDEVAQDSGYQNYEEYFVTVNDTLVGKERIDTLNRMNAEAASRWSEQENFPFKIKLGPVKKKSPYRSTNVEDNIGGFERSVTFFNEHNHITQEAFDKLKSRLKVPSNFQCFTSSFDSFSKVRLMCKALDYCVSIGKAMRIHDEYINIDSDILNAYLAGHNENS